jgi:hypothetical protein
MLLRNNRTDGSMRTTAIQRASAVIVTLRLKRIRSTLHASSAPNSASYDPPTGPDPKIPHKGDRNARRTIHINEQHNGKAATPHTDPQPPSSKDMRI